MVDLALAAPHLQGAGARVPVWPPCFGRVGAQVPRLLRGTPASLALPRGLDLQPALLAGVSAGAGHGAYPASPRPGEGGGLCRTASRLYMCYLGEPGLRGGRLWIGLKNKLLCVGQKTSRN